MTRTHVVALLALVLAVPAAAVGGVSLLSMNGVEAPCFSAGGTGYRLTTARDADYTIRIDGNAVRPDLTLQVVDDPAIADFVLVDGIENSAACIDSRTVRTIRLDPQAREADLTIALASGDTGARYKIYAHSTDFTVQDAAALYAVIWKASRKRNLASR